MSMLHHSQAHNVLTGKDDEVFPFLWWHLSLSLDADLLCLPACFTHTKWYVHFHWASSENILTYSLHNIRFIGLCVQGWAGWCWQWFCIPGSLKIVKTDMAEVRHLVMGFRCLPVEEQSYDQHWFNIRRRLRLRPWSCHSTVPKNIHDLGYFFCCGCFTWLK